MSNFASVRRSTPVATIVLSVTVLAGVLSPTIAWGDFTYDFVNYPAEQNEWVISGSITTNNNSGVLGPSGEVVKDATILSVQWAASNGTQTWTLDYPNPDNNVTLADTGYLSVTPQGIYLDPTSIEGVSRFGITDTLGSYGANYPGPWYEWSLDPRQDRFTYYLGVVTSTSPYEETYSFGVGPNTPEDIDDTGYEIAVAVPEPSTLTLLISALLGLAGAFYLRRQRAKA